VSNFGGGSLGKYFWYIFYNFISQFIIVFVSIKTLSKLSIGALYLLTILTAYFFAIIFTPIRIAKVLISK
jgi:hypothetical protein